MSWRNLNILVHDMINLLYYEHWTDKWKYFYEYFDIINPFQGWTNLSLRAILFPRPIGHARKTGAQNQSQCARLIEKQLETIIFVLCYLNRTCSFRFYCNSIKKFCNGAFAVLMLFECLKFPYISKNNSHTSDASF